MKMENIQKFVFLRCLDLLDRFQRIWSGWRVLKRESDEIFPPEWKSSEVIQDNDHNRLRLSIYHSTDSLREVLATRIPVDNFIWLTFYILFLHVEQSFPFSFKNFVTFSRYLNHGR